jgi:hypothetical protein
VTYITEIDEDAVGRWIQGMWQNGIEYRVPGVWHRVCQDCYAMLRFMKDLGHDDLVEQCEMLFGVAARHEKNCKKLLRW